MESGLDGRNNIPLGELLTLVVTVSMESGLDGRNNLRVQALLPYPSPAVSMESGLDGRNNQALASLVQRQLDESQWSPA